MILISILGRISFCLWQISSGEGKDDGKKGNEKVEDEECHENEDEDHGHNKDDLEANKDVSEPTVRDVMNALIDFGTGIDHRITASYKELSQLSGDIRNNLGDIQNNLVELQVSYGRIKEHCSSLEERIAYLERYLHWWPMATVP